jgi:hypothetical protein
MPDFIAKLLQILPPLRGPKDPGVASVVGFLTGGIGLGIYFRSFIDVLVPVVLYVFLTVAADHILEFGWVVGAIMAGYYGYVRVVDSNERLAAARSSARP